MNGATMKYRTLSKIFNLIPAWGVCFERFKLAESLIDRAADTTLELGCSEFGGISKSIISRGGRVVGVDIKKEMDASLLNKTNFSYVVADARFLPFKRDVFGQVACLDVLEHVREDDEIASEIHGVLKSGGTALVSTPSEYWRFPYFRFMRVFTASEEETLKSFSHVRKGYSIGQLEKLFSGFRIKDVKFFINGLSALGYDIEFSKLYIIENIVLKILFPILYLNFIFSSKKHGTHLVAAFVKGK